jgi:hypothetical protein
MQESRILLPDTDSITSVLTDKVTYMIGAKVSNLLTKWC